MDSSLLIALSAFVGAVSGAVIRPLVDYLINRLQKKSQYRRAALEQQLNELYRPLYENFVIMPGMHPEFYFEDWDNDNFQSWLKHALNVIVQKVHLVPDELLG